MKVVAELAWRSAALYRKAGHPDSAAQVLERAGKAVEAQLPKSCLEMLEKAAETVETENRPIQAACYTNKLLKIALNQDDLTSSLEKSKKLVHLYQVRTVFLTYSAARRHITKWPSTPSPPPPTHTHTL